MHHGRSGESDFFLWEYKGVFEIVVVGRVNLEYSQQMYGRKKVVNVMFLLKIDRRLAGKDAQYTRNRVRKKADSGKLQKMHESPSKMMRRETARQEKL